jgi:hypothetical protein
MICELVNPEYPTGFGAKVSIIITQQDHLPRESLPLPNLADHQHNVGHSQSLYQRDSGRSLCSRYIARCGAIHNDLLLRLEQLDGILFIMEAYGTLNMFALKGIFIQSHRQDELISLV